MNFTVNNKTMENNIEKRMHIGSISIEKRADGEESRTISGYAVVFDKWSRDMGFFKERITREAFNDVDMTDVVATFNHNFDNVLARVDSNTLKLSIDDNGLRYSFEAPNTTYGNDLLENVRNGNVKGSSFMFTVDEQEWKFAENDDADERTITRVGQLIELGPVTMPAYPDTTAAKRSYEANKPDMHDYEADKDSDLKVRIIKNKVTK